MDVSWGGGGRDMKLHNIFAHIPCLVPDKHKYISAKKVAQPMGGGGGTKCLPMHIPCLVHDKHTLLVIKMDFFFFFFRSNIETYCFFFGSFITLEQVSDYVMILEYQGEINICKILRHVTWPFVWSYGRPNVPYSVFFPAPSLCAMNPCFFRVNCYLCNKNRHRGSLGYSSFDIIVSKP